MVNRSTLQLGINEKMCYISQRMCHYLFTAARLIHIVLSPPNHVSGPTLKSRSTWSVFDLQLPVVFRGESDVSRIYDRPPTYHFHIWMETGREQQYRSLLYLANQVKAVDTLWLSVLE